MFTSATVKLTGWYLLILMTISLLFSVAIYQIATNEVNERLRKFQTGILSIPGFEIPIRYDLREARDREAAIAASTLFVQLMYVNIFILIGGGIGSYWLARRTLMPIEIAHEAQARFVSDASHELRTPLAVMKTELEVALHDKDISKKDLRELASSSLEEVERLTKLTNSLLAMSRLDHQAIDCSLVNISHSIETVVEKFDKNRTRITIEAPKNPVKIWAHDPSIVELITILIDNAIKYSPDDSPIHISLAVRDHKAKISVGNQGEIRTDDLPHIFERFYRGDSSRTHSETNGYGLGLALAKQIVDAHRGEISVSSASNHTIFRVSLPIKKRTESTTKS